PNVGVADADLQGFAQNPFFKVAGSAEIVIQKEVGTFRETLTGNEAIVSRIWNEVLQKNNLSRNDNFFQAGGHSLIGARIINKLNALLGLSLTFRDMYEYPTVASISAYIDSLDTEQKDVESLQQEILSVAEQDDYEVSPGQRRLWYLYRLDPYDTSYNIPTEFEIGERTTPELIKEGLGIILARHESLRTTFLDSDGEPVQVIHARDQFRYKLEITDLRAEDDPEAVYSQLNYNELQTPFDLEKGPLFRVRLVHKDTGGSLLLLTLHHIIADGISLDVLSRELHEVYSALREDRKPELPVLPIQYKDYAAWGNQRMAKNHVDKLRTYWLNKLSGQLTPLDLPFDYPYPNAVTNQGAMYRRVIPAEAATSLRNLVKSYNTSLFSVLISGYSILLQRICNQKDIIIGLPVSGRNHEALQDMIGFFLNTVMLRLPVEDQAPFEQHLQSVRKTVMEGLEYQDYPFEKIVSELDIPRDNNRFAISSAFFNMVNYNTEGSDMLDMFDSFHRSLDVTMNFDIDLHVAEYTNGLELRCLYKQELFKKETIEYLIEEYTKILVHAAIEPTLAVRKLNGLKPVNIPQPISLPDLAYEPITKEEGSIVSHFEKHAKEAPGAVALSMAGHRLTYNEANIAANRTANHFLHDIKGQKKKVALLMGHSIDMVVAMLAVLKSGNAYVPLDPLHPASRLEFILSDAECAGIITDQKHAGLASEVAGSTDIWQIDKCTDSVSGENPGVDIDRNDQAYVLYTSGSTGTPKGVVQLHKNVLHFMSAYTNNLKISKSDNLSLLPVYAFDAAVMDIYAALLNGATLCLYDMRTGDSLAGLNDFLQEENISVLHMVPTLFRKWAGEGARSEACESVRLVVLGGEACTKTDFDIFRSYFSRDAWFVNGLGPTESTVTLQYLASSNTVISRPQVPVGYPVEDTEVLVLRQDGSEACTYEAGELHFRSRYLSPGYLNLPELTERAFISENNGVRTYGTGDYAKKLPDGSLLFEGRKDKQLKVNGNRVEAGDVEAAIRRLVPDCKGCVITLDHTEGSDRLVAYVVAKNIDAANLQGQLGEDLPSYMVPALFISLEEIPTNLNGKVDMKALPDPSKAKSFASAFVEPVTDMEIEIASLYSELTGKENVGALDSFLLIGGDSHRLMKLVSRLRRDYDTDIGLRDVFVNQNVRSLSTFLDELRGKNAVQESVSIESAPTKELYVVVPEQKSIWLEERMNKGEILNHIIRPFTYRTTLDIDIFNKSLKILQQRHEILRTPFVYSDRDLYQKIHLPGQLNPVMDFRDYSDKDDDTARSILYESLNESFDIENGPLWKVTVIKRAAVEYIVAFVIHHIISDRESIELLIDELSDIYLTLKKGNTPADRKISQIQFKDYAEWLAGQVSGERGGNLRQFWQDYLSEFSRPANLETDLEATGEYKAMHTQVVFNKKIKDNIIKAAGNAGQGPFAYLLAAVKVVLHRYSGREDITVGMPTSLRDMPELENQLGLYVNNPPCRTLIESRMALSEAVRVVNQSLLKVYEHQLYPFSMIMEAVGIERKLGEIPLYNTVVIYNGSIDDSTTEIHEDEHIDHNVDMSFNTTRLHHRIVFTEFEGGLHLNIDYNGALYSKVRMEEFKAALQTTLHFMVEEPYCLIKDLDFGGNKIQVVSGTPDLDDDFDFDF
ncbi:MAG: amino acid adenylation domain-containing protein, partial [Cyclobacteriaceae bacterium]